LGASATAAVASDCSAAPRITKVSRAMIWRSRGRNIAATIAPLPMAASSTVYAAALPPPRSRATSGSSASSAVECRKNRDMRSSTDFSRPDCSTNCTPTRIALNSFSRPSGLGLCSRRQRMITKAETTDSAALSTNT
jgi:hypothetical protein